MSRFSTWRGKLAVALPVALGSFLLGRMADAGPTGAAPAKEPLVVAAARTVGVKRCLPMIAAIAQRATAGATLQDIIVDWDRKMPDSAPFFSLTGLGNGTLRAALSIAAIPSPAGCAVLVERVSYAARPCAAVASGELGGFPSGQLIDGITVYQNPRQAGETYSLISNNGGCLVLRRQASLNWAG
ncbi:hypothetical protein [Sphingomonas sp. R1]|uniref:hypothetical protein n=1 Tax=Sphingomonas sp. R1 TaxID=399176 RepID=UPI0022240D8A|nr:hypothetical protein [Sphingomonas sp. R1]UYY77316.1 hypothetical protein OIM94_17760 [Sphingomonas sp. R1]